MIAMLALRRMVFFGTAGYIVERKKMHAVFS